MIRQNRLKTDFVLPIDLGRLSCAVRGVPACAMRGVFASHGSLIASGDLDIIKRQDNV